MALGSILNVNYPLPSMTVSGPVQGQQITVTSTATVQFSTFDVDTKLVMLDVQGSSVYFTCDGTTPSSTSGHVLTSGSAFTWNKGMAAAAKFVATSTTDATIYLSELQV